MTAHWEPHGRSHRWTGAGEMPNLADYGTRYVEPPYDPTGRDGPRGIGETTELTQTRYCNGPAQAGLPGNLITSGGVWFASFDGSRWCRIDAPGASEPDFDGGDDEGEESER